MQEIRVLMTGAGGSGGSNFINSLRLVKDNRFYIVGTDSRKYYLELATNTDANYLLPKASSPEYIKKLNSIIDKEKIDFLHCQSEEEVWTVAHNRNTLKAKTLFPDEKTLEITYSKAKLHAVLTKHGVQVPKAYYPSDKKDLMSCLRDLLRKQNKAWLRAIRGGGSRASLPVYNSTQAYAWVDYWKHYQGLTYTDFMVSEFLPGKEFAFQSIWYDGKLVTSMSRERIDYLFGYLYPSGQSSSPSLAKTVHRKDVNDIGTKAVLSVDPKATGIFCVDIKENHKGIPCVTEINAGRFYTTSLFFSTAGLNMPYYYILMGTKGISHIPDLPQYNGLQANLYWVRMMDMGYKLLKNDVRTNIHI